MTWLRIWLRPYARVQPDTRPRHDFCAPGNPHPPGKNAMANTPPIRPASQPASAKSTAAPAPQRESQAASRRERIEKTAYFLAEKRGSSSSPEQNWYDAESQVG